MEIFLFDKIVEFFFRDKTVGEAGAVVEATLCAAWGNFPAGSGEEAIILHILYVGDPTVPGAVSEIEAGVEEKAIGFAGFKEASIGVETS